MLLPSFGQALAQSAKQVPDYHIIIKYILKRDPGVSPPHRISKNIMALYSARADRPFHTAPDEVPAKRTTLLDLPDKQVVIIDYTIDRSGLYIITDLGGHEVMLDTSMAGDTIELKAEYVTRKPGEKLLHLNDSVPSPWLYKLTYPQKYLYMGFFDSLAYLHEDLRHSVLHYSFIGMHEDLDSFLTYSKKVYSDRRNYLEQFAQRHFMPDKFKFYANKEIQYAFYYDLLNPLTAYPAKLTAYPVDLQDTISVFSEAFNDRDLLDNCFLFKNVLYDYTIYYPASVRGRLAWYNGHLKEEIKNYVLVSYLQLLSRLNDNEGFTLAYGSYDTLHSNPLIRAFMDSLKDGISTIGLLPPADLLRLDVEDSTHHQATLQTYFTKKLTLIDCWATWCVPCRKQIPFLDSIAQEYKGKVAFISLSADQFPPKWYSWLSKSRDSLSPNVVQLYAPGGFEHPLFRRLMITAIPRYILVSQTGNILNKAMPEPEDKIAFEKELNRYLE
jgi:thiol-disulfide isomerase/thioredoxin